MMDSMIIGGGGNSEMRSNNNSNKPTKPTYQLVRTHPGHAKAVSVVKFSPNGEWLASGGADRKLKIWSVEANQFEKAMDGHSKGINDLAWSPTSAQIATVSDDCSLHIWDISRGGKALKTFPKISPEVAFCCTYSPSGSAVAVGGFDSFIRCFDVRSNQVRPVSATKAHDDPITSVDYHRDASLISTSSFDGLVRIWDTSNLQCLKSLGASDESDSNGTGGGAVVEVPVSHARFSPNGKYIISATLDSQIKLWDYCRSKVLKTYTGHKNERFCVTAGFSVTAGKWIVAGSEDNKAYLWDLQTRECVQTLEGHNDVVISVAMHPKKNLIATASLEKDKTIRMWESPY